MGLNPGNSSFTLATGTDVAFSSLSNDDFLAYDSSISKWKNTKIDLSSINAEPAGLSDTTKVSIGLRAGINARDYLTGAQYQTAALQSAIDACQAAGINDLVIPQRDVTNREVAWVLNDTLICFKGLRIHAENALIQQTVIGKPAFTIGADADDVEISLGLCELAGARPPFSAFETSTNPSVNRLTKQLTSGIHSVASRGSFKGRFKGFRNGVRLAKPSTTNLCINNNVNILVEDVDFGLVYYGQGGLRADVRGSYLATVGTDDPPHLIYALSSPDPLTPASSSDPIIAGSMSCIIRGSAWDSVGFAFALKGQNGTVCEVLQATNCGGVVIVTDPRGPITFGQIHGIQLTGKGYPNYAKYYKDTTKPLEDTYTESIRGDESSQKVDNSQASAPPTSSNPLLTGSKTVGIARISLAATTNAQCLRVASLDDDWTISSLDIEYDTTVVSASQALLHIYGHRSQLGMIKVRNLTAGGGVVGLRYAAGTRGHNLSTSPVLRRVTNGVVISPSYLDSNTNELIPNISESVFRIDEESISTIGSTYAALVYEPTNSVTIRGSASGERRYGSGNWFPHPVGATLTNVAPLLNNLYAMPIIIQRSRAISKIAINVNTEGGTGSAMRFGIYNDTGTGMPGKLLYDIGKPANSGDPVIRFDITTTGIKELSLAEPLTLKPGTYWIAYVFQSGSGAPAIRGVTGAALDLPSATAAASLGGSLPYMSNVDVGVLPDVFAVSGTSTVGVIRISYLVA